VIISRDNFGCGSSREHAVWVFEVNNINVVIASGFARIFRQNMFNCGMLAIELSAKEIDMLFAHKGHNAKVCVDFEQDTLTVSSDRGAETIAYLIADFDKELVKADGWVEFADTKY
jgi:3-isopropylmalate/(R)-2-methylmalate dehydratase small subunit